MSKAFPGNYGVHEQVQRVFQRTELIPLPQGMTGLNDVLQMNRIRKKRGCVASTPRHNRHGGSAPSLLYCESLTLGKPAAML